MWNVYWEREMEKDVEKRTRGERRDLPTFLEEWLEREGDSFSLKGGHNTCAQSSSSQDPESRQAHVCILPGP